MEFSTKFIIGAVLTTVSAIAHAQFSATLIESSQAWGTAIADYNGDGHDDIFITGHDKNDRIWHWTRNGYVASPHVLQWSDRHDCDAADVNLDGLMDFYCAVGADKGTGTGINEMWMQEADGRHRRMVDSGAEDPYGRSRIPKFFDFNRDGYPDIYLTNLAEVRPDGQPNINRVFVNQAGTGFAEVTTIATGSLGSACVNKGDVNRDGWDDLVLCNEDGLGHIYVNDKAGNFIDLATPARGLWSDAHLADMNGDGRDDLVLVTTGNVLQVWLNTGKGAFYDKPEFEAALPFIGSSVAIGDFNHDGRQDVYVVLRDADCLTTRRDLASDLIYKGQAGGGWKKTDMRQDYKGCGRLADVVDGNKLLLVNGGGNFKGPSYLINVKP